MPGRKVDVIVIHAYLMFSPRQMKILSAVVDFLDLGVRILVSSALNNTISKFIYNWAGPGNSHDGLSNKAQKQCMIKDSSGWFTSVAVIRKYCICSH